MKKLIALLLACMMVIGMFAACNNTPAEPTDPSNETTAPVETDNNEETDAPTEPEEIVNLVWYQVGGGESANIASWTEKVNAYLEPKIGVHLDLRVIGWGDWDTRAEMIVSTGEDFDLMFTNGGTFAKYVRMGAFADLSDLIAETPGLTDLIPADYIDTCRIDGKLYAIPTYKDSSMSNYFVWDKEVVDAHYPAYTEAHTLAAIEEGLYTIKDATGEAPFRLNQDGLGGSITGNKYDAAGIGDIGIGIKYDGGTEFVPVYEQKDIVDEFTMLHKWYQDGLINSDAAQQEGQPEGRFTVGVAQGWPAAKVGWGAGRGCDVEVSQMEETVLSNDTVFGSLTAISANCKNPLKALKFLELVNTDTYLRDMLWYGEEGVNFDYVDANGNVVPYTEGANLCALRNPEHKWEAASYTQGTFFVASPEAKLVELVDEAGEKTGEVEIQVPTNNPYVDEIMPLNASAKVSPAVGFSFDPTAVEDKISNVSATFKEYRPLLFTGTGDPATLIPEMMSAMRDAGFDDILAAVNEQYAAWVAGK